MALRLRRLKREACVSPSPADSRQCELVGFGAVYQPDYVPPPTLLVYTAPWSLYVQVSVGMGSLVPYCKKDRQETHWYILYASVQCDDYIYIGLRMFKCMCRL